MNPGQKRPSRAKSSQKNKVTEYLQDDRKLNAAVANSITNKRKSPAARAIASGNREVTTVTIYSLIWQRLSGEQKKRLIDFICHEWKYCETRSTQAEVERGVYTILLIVKPISIPVCCWVFLMKYRMLDALCSCTDRTLPLDISRWLRRNNK